MMLIKLAQQDRVSYFHDKPRLRAFCEAVSWKLNGFRWFLVQKLVGGRPCAMNIHIQGRLVICGEDGLVSNVTATGHDGPLDWERDDDHTGD